MMRIKIRLTPSWWAEGAPEQVGRAVWIARDEFRGFNPEAQVTSTSLHVAMDLPDDTTVGAVVKWRGLARRRIEGINAGSAAAVIS